MNPSSTDWSAFFDGGVLIIQGKATYPNDYSTASLELDQDNSQDNGALAFRLFFNRDKEPFCGKDLIGGVHHWERNVLESATFIKVVSEDGQQYEFPIKAKKVNTQ